MERPPDPEPRGDPMLDEIQKIIDTMGGGVTPEHYELLGRKILGLDDKDVHASSIPLEVRDALGILIHRNAQTMASPDATDRAEAARFFDTLSESAQRVRGGMPEKSPDERFVQQSLSGMEVRSCLIEVLDDTDSLVADMTRRQYGIPPGSVPQQGDAQERPQTFAADEQHIAATVLNISIGVAEAVAKANKFTTVSQLLGSEKQRRQIEEIALASDRIGIGTPEQRRAAVQSVFDKLPHLLRLAFERQQQQRSAMRRAADEL